MAKTIETESSPVNIITAGTKIKGDITATGDFRLDGMLEGNIQLNGKLVVGDTGIVKGNIMCQNANIIGTVDGNLSVKELLSLHATARITGDILINKLSIEPGAVFTGRCRMLDEIRAKQESSEPAAEAEQE
jgi:cytoskeletal protein CcmA (bactofilin family)